MMMMKSLLDTHLVPKNITNYWNIGSMLGIFMTLQIFSGVYIASIHPPNSATNFYNSVMLNEKILNYWMFKMIHMNLASLLFLLMYLHMGRGIYYSSYNLKFTWLIGMILYMLTMASAFLGYVLPMNQMSFWAASVIINMMGEFPFIGSKITVLIWGEPTVGSSTVSRFFVLHYLIPFIILFFMIIHIMFLHKELSSNPLGLNNNLTYNYFQPLYSKQDFLSIMMILLFSSMFFLNNPEYFCNNDNFMEKNNKITPNHIQPEWYFLFLYTILRSIPNKTGGVLLLLMAILIIMLLPYFSYSKMKGLSFYPINKMMFWMFVSCLMILTWVGSKPANDPYINIGMISTYIYFIYFPSNILIMKIWDYILFPSDKSY